MRALITRLHRYAGLATALFLVIAGTTGSLLAFYHELDALLNPELFHAKSRRVSQSPLAIAAAIERADPRLQVTWLPLSVVPGHSLELGVGPRIDPLTQKAFDVEFDQMFVDPSDGRELGRRQWGACCLSRAQVMPFVYALHYSLFIPGQWGIWLMGLVGVVWVLDSFLGLALTLPRRASRGSHDVGRLPCAITAMPQGYLARWYRAWRIKSGAGRARFNFDLHRAGGLWFWPVLLTMAVSSVSFNLHEEVFEPVVDAFSSLSPTPFDARIPRAPELPIERTMSLAAIVDIAGSEALRRKWSDAPSGVYYGAAYGIAAVRFGADHAAGLGNRWVYVDGGSGVVLGALVPGEGTAGDLLHQLQFPLHSGQIAGLPGRIFIFVTGVAVAVLSISGVLIWARKRRVRSVRRSVPQCRGTSAAPVVRF